MIATYIKTKRNYKPILINTFLVKKNIYTPTIIKTS